MKLELLIDEEFEQLENDVYQCLYDQGICEISQCRYFDKCEVCKKYIDAVEKKFPLFEVK